MNVSVRDLIYCKVCNELFDKPVMLPCGETICSKHEIDFKDARFQCTFCSGQHKLASETDHFPCNKIAQGLLEKQLQELNLGDIHKSAVASLKSLKESVQNFESFGDNAEDYIYEYFAKLRNQVDLQREAMIQKVNDSSDKLLCEIAALETKCKINCNKPGSKLPKADQLAQLKSEVGEWEKCLGKLVIDERQWTNIKKQCYESKAKLENDLQTFKDEVISCDVKSDDIERRFSNFDQFFLHDLGLYKGTLKLEIGNLKFYDMSQKDSVSLYSFTPTYIHNLPFRIHVNLRNNNATGLVEMDVFLDAELFMPIMSGCELDTEYEIGFVTTDNTGFYKLKDCKRTFTKANGLKWCFDKVISLKQILNRQSLNIYNKDSDSVEVQINAQVSNFIMKR